MGVFNFDPAAPVFVAKVRWVQSAVPGSTYSQTVGLNTNPTGVGPVRTLTYVFHLGPRAVVVDGPSININPDSCADAVAQELGLPNAHGDEKFEQRVRRDRDAVLSPVGAPWPEKGSNIFRFNPRSNPIEFDEGATYSGDLDGREVTWRRVRVVIRPGEGPMGAGGEYAPAWQLVTA